MDDLRYLVWSNQRRMWWMADRTGYTYLLEDAGRYSGTEALDIVNGATLNGQLTHDRDPGGSFAGRSVICVDEHAMIAPESLVELFESIRSHSGVDLRPRDSGGHPPIVLPLCPGCAAMPSFRVGSSHAWCDTADCAVASWDRFYLQRANRMTTKSHA